MTSRTAAQALAAATSALTGDHDVTDMLARLVRDCAELLSAAAIGVLVLNSERELELLTSTSHRVAELELFQIQHDSGPCVEAVHTAGPVSAVGAEQIQARWPVVGPAIVDAGYQAVHAFPLRWHGKTLGALNVFLNTATAVRADQQLYGQTFADLATILIVQNTDISLAELTARVEQALQARTAIEQAKGVMAHQYGLDMAAAYDRLLSMRTANSSLTATAAAVIAQARQRN